MGVNNFTRLPFTLAASERQLVEMGGIAVIYVAEGSATGLSPGAVTAQLDDGDEFPLVVGDFIRIKSLDRIRLINKTGASVSGVLYVSADPDFLYLSYPRGL